MRAAKPHMQCMRTATRSPALPNRHGPCSLKGPPPGFPSRERLRGNTRYPVPDRHQPSLVGAIDLRFQSDQSAVRSHPQHQHRRVQLAAGHRAIPVHAKRLCGCLRQRCAHDERHAEFFDCRVSARSACARFGFQYQRAVWFLGQRRRRPRLLHPGLDQSGELVRPRDPQRAGAAFFFDGH